MADVVSHQVQRHDNSEQMIARRLLLLSFRASAAFSSSAPTAKAQQRVHLIGLDGKIIGIKTKAEAEAIAKKSNLILKRKHGLTTKEAAYELYDPKSDFDPIVEGSAPVSITDKVSKTNRAIGVREKKKVQIGANITDHDIETKAKAIAKFLKANCEVQIVAFGHVKSERLEEIYQQFEQLFTGLRFVQKIVKSGSLKFTILPDPEKFTGLNLKHSSSVDDNDDLDPEACIDDKELEELIEEKLKEKKD